MTELIIAFGAGLISFLSPCVLPLIPGYIAFISGSTFNELLEKKINLTPIIYFTLGFSIIFIIFGMAATFIGQLLLKNSNELRIIAGIIPINVLNKAVDVSAVTISLTFSGATNRLVKFLLQISSRNNILKLMLDRNKKS